jgi:NTE family protein
MNVHADEIRTNRASATVQPEATSIKRINLALQGGGAHGAFTWDVLDRLLEDPRIAIEGISATSAGAMNAAVLAYGLTVRGREGAKNALMSFWRRIAHAAMFSPLQPSLYDRMSHNYGLENSPAHLIFDLLTRTLSPYQLNPLNHNPLLHMIMQVVDFERLRSSSAIKLFLSATNVRTGKVKIFSAEEITVDCVLAATCPPYLYQAVEIEGEHYWDGGYMGNPALFPLIYACTSRNILVVHINPMQRPEVPTTAREILNRVNEISFNASLMREMRAVAFVTKLIDDGKLAQGEVKRMLVHAIAADDVMQGLSAASKLNADWDFLMHLRNIGRDRTQAWIENHIDDLGTKSTIDLHATYL